MSLRGVRQCKKLLIRYSDLDGSSRGVREWMKSHLVDFAALNPAMSVQTELKRAVHPFVRGYYENGNSKTIGIKNLDSDEINDYVFDLRNQIGRKTSGSGNGYSKPVLSTTPSVQGEWNEEIDLTALELTMEHRFDQPHSVAGAGAGAGAGDSAEEER